MSTERRRMVGPGTLDFKLHRDALIGLYMQHKQVGLSSSAAVCWNSASGAGLNWMAISVTAFWQALAMPQIEGHARPAPVVYVEAPRHVRFGCRSWGVRRLLGGNRAQACRR